MANGWTEERRARQAERIKQWRPWEKSTGPKSEDGKKRASLNAFKHGVRSAEWAAVERRVSEALRQCHGVTSDAE